jgi:uncharacterized protein
MSKEKKEKLVELPEILRGRKQLQLKDKFCFGCHPGVSCFTNCCADINILMTPLDVLRLARRIGMDTQEFLGKHTLTPISKDLQLPIVMLKMEDDEEKRCPFLGEEGCSVYEDRPWACRMYPLGSALPPARSGVEPEAIYFLFEDDFCEGGKEKEEWTVEDWRKDQGVVEQEELEEGYREIVSHPWFIGGTRQLNPKQMEMFHMACFNLDTFRRFVFDSTFLTRFEIDDETIEKMRDSDEALLDFAFRWVRLALFAEPTIKVRESVQKPGRKS